MIFNDDIFVIGEYVNFEKKEKTLISLIKVLKQFNIPILLSGHYPVNPEIQKMVDYYLFDKENPFLTADGFEKYGMAATYVWIETNDWKSEIRSSSGDYAEWALIRNAVNFVKYLGKKNIHYIDYDNIPMPYQYASEFLIPMKNHDASVLPTHEPQRYLTFIFSIKTDIALDIFNRLKTEEDYYRYNKTETYFLEHIFFTYLNEISNNIYISKYQSIGNDLALHDISDGKSLTIFILCDEDRNLYIQIRTKSNINEFLIIVGYNGIKTEYFINNGYPMRYGDLPFQSKKEFILEIGKYIKGETVRIYYEGNEVSSTTLDMEYKKYIEYNKITIKNKIR